MDKKPKLEPRQDTVYFDHSFTNNWNKIEALTNMQIKAGKKGVQPDFGVNGREGIVRTFHETCWVCEKRKYVLLTVDTDPMKKLNATWGPPIMDEYEKMCLKQRYLPNGQLPGQLQGQPILISSMNDWFPIHLMPCVTFAMLFDYSLMQDLARSESMRRNTQDSVTKFREGYQRIMDHATGKKLLDAGSIRLYQTMWRNYILKNLLYPHDTLFIDFPSPEEEADADYMFMWAGFVKPGKHRSLLYVPGDDMWYKRDFFVDERETELPNFANYENLVENEEHDLQSVMKEWKVDSQDILLKCIEQDEVKWGFNNKAFMKDPNE